MGGPNSTKPGQILLVYGMKKSIKKLAAIEAIPRYKPRYVRKTEHLKRY